jgi:hypothetical protein
MKEWLWVHQRFFLDEQAERPEESFKVWPDLLILGPEGAPPILPLRPPSRFGYWFHSVDRWLDHVRTWRSLPSGVVLNAASVRRIADQLHLVKIWPNGAGEPEPEPVPVERDPILARLQALEERVARLESALETLGGGAEADQAGPEPSVAVQQPLSDAEKAALLSAVTTARLTGKSRAVPTIISYMDRLLGYRLKEVAYNGRGTATALMEQARAEGLVIFGPPSGPNATIYLPDEDVPAA